MRGTSVVFLLCLLGIVGPNAACGGADGELGPPDGAPKLPSADGGDHAVKLIDGLTTRARPEIGRIGGCTATLVAPAAVLTAAHCMGFGSRGHAGGGQRHATFRVDRADGYSSFFSVDAYVSFGTNLGRRDMALLHLADAVSADVAQPAAIADRTAAHGEEVTLFGYGCSSRRSGRGGGNKQKVVETWDGHTSHLCPGDSGGPGVLGSDGPVFLVHSGYWVGNGQDIVAEPWCNLARQAQETLEEDVLYLAWRARKKTRAKNLCLAGGAALNCIINRKIMESGLFRDLFIQPAASDEGIPLGAALHGYYASGGEARWQPVLDFFPWEDHRQGRPPALGPLDRALDAWVDADPRRRARVDALFAPGADQRWSDSRVLERYELLYEAGLVQEASRDTDRERPALPSGAPMASDHRRILATGLGRLRSKLRYRPVLFDLVPPTFTLSDLQRGAEAITGITLHKQNFRRGVERTGLVSPTGRFSTGTGGRPAELFTRSAADPLDGQTLGLPLPALR